MSLPRAYCLQTGTVTDIFTARQFYFAQSEPREKLEFRCASAECRLGKNPLILGINYTKIPGVDEFVQQPHYRTNKGELHDDDCPFVEYQEAVDEMDAENPLDPPISGVKRSMLVEVFAPVAEGEGNDIDAVDTQVLEGVKEIKDRRKRIDAIKDLLRKIPNRTRRLHEAVKCFLAMTKDQRKTTPFQIEGYPRYNYSAYFKYAAYSAPERRLPCIYYGRVNVRYWQTKTPFYSLRFKAHARDNEGNERTVTVRVPEGLLRGSHDRAYYETLLATAVGLDGHTVTCFVYGHIALAERDPDKRIDITIDNLQSLDIWLAEEEAIQQTMQAKGPVCS